jgi:hypothetical protein
MTPTLVLFARAALGVVLSVAVAAKAPVSAVGRDRFTAFARSLAPLPGLSGQRVRTITAAATLAAEAGSVALLAALPRSAVGLCCAGAVLAALTAGVALIVRSGAEVRCHCFGAGESTVLGPAELYRNLVLTVVAGIAATLSFATTGSLPAAPVAVIIGAAGALAGLCVTHGADLRWLTASAPSR